MTKVPDEVSLEHVPCPNGCREDDQFVLEGKDRLHNLPGIFTVVQCKACSLMRTNPRPSGDTIGYYYPSNYGPYKTEANEQPLKRHKIKDSIHNFLGLKNRIIPKASPGRLMELGCANGVWLAEMESLGWTVEGIEFSSEAAEVARKRGLNVQIGAVETAIPPAEPVDLIAAWMVLEHLHSPVQVLQKLRQWIKPDGLLVASIPDVLAFDRKLFGDRWFALQLPTHLYHYSPDSIRIMLRGAGWNLINVRWQRNCNNLLWSLCYLAEDFGWKRSLRFLNWLRSSPRAEKIRVIISVFLGAIKQSGRIEICAQPILNSDD